MIRRPSHARKRRPEVRAGSWRGIAGVLAGCCLLATPGVAQEAEPSGDWSRNRVVLEGAPGDGVEKLVDLASPLWRADLGTEAYGGPSVGGGLVLVGTNNERPRDPEESGDRGVVMAFDALSGELRWQHTHPKLEVGATLDWPLQGVCSAPATDERGVVYLSNRGEVISADFEGRITWRTDLVGALGVRPRHMSATSPVLWGDLVLLHTSNGTNDEGVAAAPEAPSFVALRRSDGQVVWSSDQPSARLIEGQWASATMASRGEGWQVLFPAGDGWVYSLEPRTGEELWRFDGNRNVPGDAPERDRHAFVATAVALDGVAYLAVGRDPEAASAAGTLWALSTAGKGELAGDSGDRAVQWSFEDDDLGRSISTVAVTSDVVYLADLNGFLFAVDRASGTKLWTYDAFASIWSSPLVVGERIVLGDTDGDLTILRAGRSLEVVAEHALDGPIYGSPVFSDGRLYVATSSTLWAFGRTSDAASEARESSRDAGF